MWGWLASSFLNHPSCPFWRLKWHWLSSSLQAPLPLTKTFQRWERAVQQSRLTVLQAHVGASHWGPWICVHWFWLDALWPDPPQPMESLPLPRLSYLQGLGFSRNSLSNKDWSEEGIWWLCLLMRRSKSIGGRRWLSQYKSCYWFNTNWEW